MAAAAARADSCRDCQQPASGPTSNQDPIESTRPMAADPCSQFVLRVFTAQTRRPRLEVSHGAGYVGHTAHAHTTSGSTTDERPTELPGDRPILAYDHHQRWGSSKGCVCWAFKACGHRHHRPNQKAAVKKTSAQSIQGRKRKQSGDCASAQSGSRGSIARWEFECQRRRRPMRHPLQTKRRAFGSLERSASSRAMHPLGRRM